MSQRILFNIVAWIAASLCAAAQAIHGREGIRLPAPPVAEAVPVADDYFGTKILDSYRWLEDAKSAETQAFVEQQNAYAARYMKQARIRADAADDLEALEDISAYSIPILRTIAGGEAYFFEKRLAGEEQASIYLRRGSAGPSGSGKAGAAGSGPGRSDAGKDVRLVDPAALSRDPQTSVRLLDVGHDGSLVAFAVRQGGAEEATVRLADAHGKLLEDELPAGAYRSVCFTPDGKGIYYTRSNRQGTLLYLHLLGERPSKDTLIFGRAFHGEELGATDLITASVTDDGRYLVVRVERGIPVKRVDIVFRDLSRPTEPFVDLVWGMEVRFAAIYAKGGWYVQTDYQAPKGRILKADPGILADVWKTVVPEGMGVIDGFSIVGGKLYVRRLKDAQTEISAYTLEGKPADQIELEGMATASVPVGRMMDRHGFYSVESFIAPPAIYRLDTATGKSEIFAQPKTSFEASAYEVRQVFFPSKDGTQIPMFIVGKKGLKRDGTERLLMTGYGGFGVSMTPAWNPAYAWWLEQGGWFALPNLRGGGEYGEHWHEQGILEKKQTVFDDWFAAAEYLIANEYTAPRRLAITGQGNGGLLMGAAITQRPELFGAVVCASPLLDMLRYQRFPQSARWIAEYGSAENEKQFFVLLKYSPYHNVSAGTAYPAVLFFAGEEEPGRADARKMTALLQSASTSKRPILLEISASGEASVEQRIQGDADQIAFLWTETAVSGSGK